jgi:ABC-2 type transport system ATP-binding protein
MIEVQDLTKKYGDLTAVDGLSFKVDEGKIWGLLGPNAAGKTTTMRILTGYLPATEGTATVAGFDVFEQADSVRKAIGYLPEVLPLYPDMTVSAYLDFVAEIKQVPAARRKEALARVLKATGLEDNKGRLIKNISRGYKQRVGIAQAMIHDPRVIILDEPTIGLDPKQIFEVRTLIKGLAGEHTVVLSTHILPEVSMTCNRVVIINNGRVVAMDTPEGLTNQMKGAERIALTVEGPREAVKETLGGLECRLQTDLRRVLAETVVSQGWGLLELRGVSMSLEDVFINLVTQE